MFVHASFLRTFGITVLTAWALHNAACTSDPVQMSFTGPTAEWESYGRDPGGARYSPLNQITRENVSELRVEWTYRTGDVSDEETGTTTAFEATPIVVDGTLFVCTPFNRIIALDPESGEEKWVFDPELDLSVSYGNQFVCRGLATWVDPGLTEYNKCRRRILTATNDARLIALDSKTGEPCVDFGNNGEVNLAEGVGGFLWKGEYQMTSAPVVVGDAVVVGSAVSDNVRMDAPSGVVRAYDVRSGALRWAWDPLPPELENPPQAISNEPGAFRHGTANAWAPLSADEERNLVFIPTGNTSPDYYGGLRNGSDYFSSSTVALRGDTGEVAWHFQTVHHDLWDFDVPAQPSLLTVRRGNEEIPAVVQATKMGFLFFLHRETGEPLFPVEERPVPQSTVPGETTSATQPFPTLPPPLVPQEMTAEEAWGMTPWDRGKCREAVEALKFDGIYTPPSLEGTLMFPGNAGGSNWGGVAIDPERNLVIANTMNLAWAVTLIPRERFDEERKAHPGIEHGPQRGTPYGMRRELLMSPLGIPCTPPPWGMLAAVDTQSGEIRWQVTLGTIRDIAPIPLPIGRWGAPNIGGPIVTGSGLVFIGATVDNYLRAFDIDTGEELWKGRLPAGGQATPMTYRLTKNSKQFVVIAAGGHGRANTDLGDYLVAFSLPD